MHEGTVTTIFIAGLHFAAQIAQIIRILLRPARETASRVAWTVVILSLPLFGILAFWHIYSWVKPV